MSHAARTLVNFVGFIAQVHCLFVIYSSTLSVTTGNTSLRDKVPLQDDTKRRCSAQLVIQLPENIASVPIPLYGKQEQAAPAA